MSYSESAVVFPCCGENLLGILAQPEVANKTGVLIIVGGPQYRVGSHRQFLLLSRALASEGYPVMRFDYRGMGDSTGDLKGFEHVSADIGAAIDTFLAQSRAVERVVLWGLCDAASASLLYVDATSDQRVAGLILLNPWVRSEASLAKTHVKHYYGQRLFQADFWKKLLTGQVGVGRAIGGLISNLKQVSRGAASRHTVTSLSFQDRMLRGLKAFDRPTLIVLSGNDYTAKEFIESTKVSTSWQVAMSRLNVDIKEIIGADHTFSSAEWRQGVKEITVAWLKPAVD